MKKANGSQLIRLFITLCIIITCSIIYEVEAQINISGKVVDQQGGPLPSASVIALSKSDSVMVGFGITNVQGKFRIEDLEEGEYLIQSSFLGYKDDYYSLILLSKDKKQVVLEIVLEEGQMKLDEVVITADYLPVKFNNDTIQYNAAAFSVKSNEAVEELLRKLPGVEIAKDGSIKAQGETVGKVLVEGKEFFGNDPTIATRNLPADAVDKVQVFDKKSEMAEFSGIDDGMEQKTINLVLKDDRKKGIFGTGKAGLGSEDRYDSKFNINSFKGDATWTAIGMANNINEQGFSVMDYIDFMGGLGSFGGSGGRIRINTEDLGIPIGQDLGQGFVNTVSGGINYNLDLNDKSEVSGSYFYSRIDNDVDRNTFRQNLLENESFNTEERAETNTLSNGHTLNLKFRSKMDSLQRITLGGNLNFNNGSSASLINRLLTSDNVAQNQLMSEYESNGERINYGINGTYNRRLGKRGRIFSLNGNIRNRNNDNESLIQTLNTFFLFGGTDIVDTLRQRQLNENNAVDYSIGMSYTEPLGNSRYVEFNFSHQTSTNDFTKDFYDIIEFGMIGDSDQEQFNMLLSDLYKGSFVYNRLGFNYKINRKKYNLTLGVNLQHSDQKGEVGSSEVTINNDYLSVLPLLRLDYDVNSSNSFRMDYFTDIREPSLQQLQPQIDNSDPLYIYQGNPDLRPEYSHHLNLNYHAFSSFTDVIFFSGINFRYTKDKITNAQFINENFVQTTTPVNVDRNINVSSYFSLTGPIRSLGLKSEISTNLNYNNGILFINQIENNTSNWNNNYSLTIENRKKKNFDVLVGATISHNVRNYSKSDHLDQSFFNYNYYTDISKDFGEKWSFKTSLDYMIYPEESFGEATDLALWKASISMNLLKYDKGQLTLSVVDILDQNKGINRTSTLNYYQDERVVSLGRYAMLTFGYSFSGFGKKDDMIQVESRRRR